MLYKVVNPLVICASLEVTTLLSPFGFRNRHRYGVDLFFVLSFFFWRAVAAGDKKRGDD